MLCIVKGMVGDCSLPADVWRVTQMSSGPYSSAHGRCTLNIELTEERLIQNRLELSPWRQSQLYANI